MLRLTRFREREDGAIAIIVAMLFFFGVMLALGALTVDVGNINADRRQLQNGADAVALAVAQQCAKTGTCAPTDPGVKTLANNLQTLANANAADNATAIRRVDGQRPFDTTGLQETDLAYPAICGNATGLDTCDPLWTQSMSNLQECPSTPPPGVNYVRVYAETKNSVGNNILPYYFGAAVTGIKGANQQACATVVWGPPSGAAAPIALSYCEWAAATGYQAATPGPPATAEVLGTYAADPTGAWPGYGAGHTTWPAPSAELTATSTPTPVPGDEIIIGLEGSSGKCASWNTHDAPGGFGYLATATGCEAAAVVNGWIAADSGNTLPGGCPSLFPYFNKVLYLPVFDCVVKSTTGAPSFTPVASTACLGGAGGNTWYHVEGYAKFYLSGYTTSGGGASAIPDKNNARTQTATPPCSDPVRCLSGWFLKGLVYAPPAPPTPDAGGPPLGAYSITLAG